MRKFTAMLWKKESNNENSLYLDILAFYLNKPMKKANSLISKIGTESIPQKNDALSLKLREEGNALYAMWQLDSAIEKYNDSLRFAKQGSQNISLAYANRSACYLVSKMYKECLKDIELAKEANYPEHLMSKLERRKAECLEAIDKGALGDASGKTLSFEADEKFPCMANVLKVERDAGGTYSVVAKEDINVGQTIVSEKAFRTFLVKRFGFKCNICLKGYTNLMPCEKCVMAMFCSIECRTHFLHDYECGVSLCNESSFNSVVMDETRGILQAVNIFSDVNELINCVEQTITSDPKVLPPSLVDDRSKYQAYVASGKTPDVDEDMAYCVYATLKSLFSILYINQMFKRKKHIRFLMHLVAFHWANGLSFDDHNLTVSGQIDLMVKYFKHSCIPNVLHINGNGMLICVAVQQIKKGDQLFVSRIPIGVESTETRQRDLREKNIICECTRCKGIITVSRAQRLQFMGDPGFLHANLSNYCHLDDFNRDKNKAMIDKCSALLAKYGHIGWCDEIKSVMLLYQHLLHVRLEHHF